MRYINHLFKVFTTALFLSGVNLISAQVTETVKDSITITDEFKGTVTYDMYRKANEVIKHKNYQITADRIDPLGSNYFNQLTLAGTYTKNDRDQTWEYSFKKLTPSKNAEIDGYKLVQLGTGEEYIVDAKFKNGNANGEWEVVNRIIDNSIIDKETYKAKTTFKDNAFFGYFESECDSLEATGQINKRVFFDGEWIFSKKNNSDRKLSEHRFYDDGILMKHLIKVDNKTFQINHIGLDKTVDDKEEIWEEINVNEDYFNILFNTNFNIENDALSFNEINTLINNSNDFLKHSIFSFGKHKGVNIWQIDNGKDIVYPKLKVRKFPYTEEEKEQITEALMLIKNANKIVTTFLEDPQVDINKHSYKEVALYFEIYNELHDELLHLESVFELFDTPSYEYINREKIIPHIFDDIIYPKSITFEYNDKKTTEFIAFPKSIMSHEATFIKLYEAVKEINTFIVNKNKIVSPIVERNKKRAKIAEKEAIVVRKRDSIINLFINKEGRKNYNEYHERYKSKVIDFTKDCFKRYAQQEIESRIEEIDELLNCFDAFLLLYEKLEKFPEKEAYIKELYTRTVWNPYTFTDMEENIKERIYNAFNKQILPYILEDIEASINCEQIKDKTENLQIVYDKMKFLREQDTKKIEKEIKREKDVFNIIKTFDLDLN